MLRERAALAGRRTALDPAISLENGSDRDCNMRGGAVAQADPE
jgi:hypothetical protein